MTTLYRRKPLREHFEPELPAAPVAALELEAEVEVALADVPGEVTLPEVPDTPEGRMPDVTLTDADVVVGTDVELELAVGSVLVTPVGGKLTLVDGPPVWCGGSVLELDAARVCGWVAEPEEDASLAMIVNAGLISPEVPSTALVVRSL